MAIAIRAFYSASAHNYNPLFLSHIAFIIDCSFLLQRNPSFNHRLVRIKQSTAGPLSFSDNLPVPNLTIDLLIQITHRKASYIISQT